MIKRRPNDDLLISRRPNRLPSLDTPTCHSSYTYAHTLRSPRISPPSGTFPDEAFPLKVTLRKHVNDPADTQLFYSPEPGLWLLYEEPISVSADSEITVYASNADPQWEDSEVDTASYLSEVAAE